MKAYKDSNDGYYQFDGEGTPAWAAGMTPTEVITKAPIDPQLAINAKAQAYLDSTDWMVLRQADSGEAMHNSIKDARAAARLEIK
jgi:hypothetical protein